MILINIIKMPTKRYNKMYGSSDRQFRRNYGSESYSRHQSMCHRSNYVKNNPCDCEPRPKWRKPAIKYNWNYNKLKRINRKKHWKRNTNDGHSARFLSQL